MLLGFNTGLLYKTTQPTSDEAVFLCRDIGCNIIELCCSDERVPLLKNIKKSYLESFKKATLHFPETIFLKGNKELRLALDSIQLECNRLNIDQIVVHADVVKDWSVFDNYNFQITIENMDQKKKIGKTVKDIRNILAGKDIGLTLDLNHCFDNDKTMKLADEFIDEFSDKIREIHLSGHKNKIFSHVPLYKTKQLEILKRVPNKDIPIVIESVCDSLEGAKKEYAYIKNHLFKQFA